VLSENEIYARRQRGANSFFMDRGAENNRRKQLEAQDIQALYESGIFPGYL